MALLLLLAAATTVLPPCVTSGFVATVLRARQLPPQLTPKLRPATLTLCRPPAKPWRAVQRRQRCRLAQPSALQSAALQLQLPAAPLLPQLRLLELLLGPHAT